MPRENREVPGVDLRRLHEALFASWDASTSFRGEFRTGNPAHGQCYPTARVVQHFFPETEVAEGRVWTGSDMEKHFWNVLEREGAIIHIDLTWRQFPPRSCVRSYAVRHRSTFADGPATELRVKTLLRRVAIRLGENYR